ncbi:MAG: hypothetical protein FJY82_04840 [Candidatus Aminicenantes bacterium]|nr:hypothetical protein [Candidatus Aminicenantes bacterium]
MIRSRGSVLAASAFILAGLLLAAEAIVVKVQTTPLRRAPEFFAPEVAKLKAGDRLELLAVQGAWRQVKTAAGLTGWVHSSAADVAKFNLLAMSGGTKTETSAKEAALAGKGFSREIEQSYRAKNPGVSYAWVDKMIALGVPPGQVEDFIAKGKLGEAGGAR